MCTYISQIILLLSKVKLYECLTLLELLEQENP